MVSETGLQSWLKHLGCRCQQSIMSIGTVWLDLWYSSCPATGIEWCLVQEGANPAQNAADVLIEEIDDQNAQVSDSKDISSALLSQCVGIEVA